MDGIFEGSKEEQDLGCMVGGEQQSEFHDCVLCFQTCVWSCTVTLKEYFSTIFMRSNAPEMCLQGFKILNLQI
jgi:hypothetical protein